MVPGVVLLPLLLQTLTAQNNLPSVEHREAIHAMFNMAQQITQNLLQNTPGFQPVRQSVTNQPLKFIVIGDWGAPWAADSQKKVADAMALYAEANHPSFIVTTGDNIYPNGVQYANDTAFNTLWRDIYNHDSLKDLPWYITLGNHDYDQNPWAQKEFGNIEERWILPWLWHKASFTAQNCLVELYILDTFAWWTRQNDYELMVEWLTDELNTSQADYKLVFGHRHIFSAGTYGPRQYHLYKELRPILEDNGVDMYVNGHDHSLQYITDMTDPTMTDYIISGGGGAGLRAHNSEAEEELNSWYNKEVLFFESTNGFVAFTIDDLGITTDYYNSSAELTMIFTHVRPKYTQN